MTKLWTFLSVVALGSAAAFSVATSGVFDAGTENAAPYSSECADQLEKVTETYVNLSERMTSDEQAIRYPTTEELEVLSATDPELHQLYQQEKSNTVIYELRCSFNQDVSRPYGSEADFALIRAMMAAATDSDSGAAKAFLQHVAAVKCDLNPLREQTGRLADIPEDIRDVCATLL
jgi:hypothetical protein